jgi:hypothetical protein
MDEIKDFFSKLSIHNLPEGVAILLGIVLFFVVLKAEKFALRLIIIVIAIALFFGAYWWHHHQ